MNKLWQVFQELATRNNCQIIATTHSFEFASYITEVDGFNDDNFSFITIVNEKNHGVVLTYAELKDSVENKLEIR